MSDTEAQLIKCLDIILSPVITEKATMGAERNEVAFRVPLEATKPMIRQAVEQLFKVKVKSVNTLVQKGKKKHFRGLAFKKSDTKKAIVTLVEGYSIDISTGL